MKVNPDYDPATTVGKAATEGGVVLGGATIGALVGNLVVNSLRTAGKAPWGPDLDGYAVTVAATAVASLAAGLKKAARNIRKHRWIPLVAVMGLAVGLAGCATTTTADGTRTVSLDGQAVAGAVDTAFAAWDRLESRRRLLEEEKARAEAARDRERVAIVERELARLAPELERAAEAVGDRIEGVGR